MHPGHEEAESLLYGDANAGAMPFISGAILSQDARLAHRRTMSSDMSIRSFSTSPTSHMFSEYLDVGRKASLNEGVLPSPKSDDGDADTFSIRSNALGASPRLFTSVRYFVPLIFRYSP